MNEARKPPKRRKAANRSVEAAKIDALSRRIRELDDECENLRVALEDASEQAEGFAEKADESEQLKGELRERTRQIDAFIAESGRRLQEADREAIAALRQLQEERERSEIASKELEIANEELQAANEELNALNEELQATNEELREAKEELEDHKTHLEEMVRERTMALRQSLAEQKALVDTAPVTVIGIDERGIVRSFSPAGEKLFGYQATEVIGKNVAMLMPPPYHDEHDGYVARYLKTGEKRIIGIGRNVNARRKDGSVFPIHLSVGEVTVDGRRMFTGFIQDLSALVAAQRAVAEELEFTTAILDTTDALVVALDPGARIVRFNPACERLTGFSAKEMIGKPIWRLVPPEQQDVTRAMFDRLIGGETMNRHENDWLTKDGERRLIYWSNAVLRSDDGTIRNVLATGLDLTERRRDEERIKDLRLELYQIGRVSELGAMAAAIAHELNQPLSAVMNYSQASLNMLGALGEVPPKPREYMEKTIAQAERAGEIVRRLRQLIGHHEASLELCDLNELVRDASALALVGVGEAGIRSTLSLSPNLPQVLADKTQIQQVVLNLVRNAVEAVAGSENREIAITTAPAADGGARVGIADTGHGLDKTVAENLFQPFTTTKASGMGVGLSICRSIIEAHNGKIWAIDNPGGGTIFNFRLPAAAMEDEEENTRVD